MQLFALKETDRNDEDGNIIRLVIARKDLEDDKVAIVAHGYEGGGCWTDYYAILQLDSFQESVEEIVESWIASGVEDSENQDTFDEINQYIQEFVFFDDSCIPRFRTESIESEEYDIECGTLEIDWDWDAEIMPAISEDWQFLDKWN